MGGESSFELAPPPKKKCLQVEQIKVCLPNVFVIIIFIDFRCHPCKKEQSIRAGSFFSQAKLSITQIIDIMYAYSYEKASYKSLAREIRIESEAICNWRNFIRDVYVEHLIRNPVRIGGVGRTVEIDESAFVKKKHNVRRQVRTQ